MRDIYFPQLLMKKLSSFFTTCPFHKRKDYTNLEIFETLQQKTWLTEAVRQLSHEELNYPWKEISAELNKVFRAEFDEMFQDLDEYIDLFLENKSPQECLQEYKNLIGATWLEALEETKFIPLRKSIDAVTTDLETYRSQPVIGALLDVIWQQMKVDDTTYKQATMKVLREVNSRLKKWKSLVSSLQDTHKEISTELHEWLIKLASLQERWYSSEQLEHRNSYVAEHSNIIDAICIMHYVLHTYVQNYCTQNPKRFTYTFHPIQELCKHDNGILVPNPRFFKIIVSNRWPMLLDCRENDKDIISTLQVLNKDKKVFEQYIFGFDKQNDKLELGGLEIKSCPAKKVLLNAWEKILPFILHQLSCPISTNSSTTQQRSLSYTKTKFWLDYMINTIFGPVQADM